MKRFVGIIPAAGIGSRMGLMKPKQYCHLAGKTVLEHSIDALYSHPAIAHIVVVLHPEDHLFHSLALANNAHISTVIGGANRADSVLMALNKIKQMQETVDAVFIHDAVRPCLKHSDIDRLLDAFVLNPTHGALLAVPVRDTMKRATPLLENEMPKVIKTVTRDHLWHALTPQIFLLEPLTQWLTQAIAENIEITDEASVFELNGMQPQLVLGRSDNIKITYYQDLALADFYLQQE